MTFFYDLNKKLAGLVAPKEQINEGKKPDFLDVDKDGNKKESFKQAVKDAENKKVEEGSTGDYSAKKARAGKDIGKPGKAFAKIAKSAGERYGSKERGEKVAGAVLAKLRKEDVTDEGNAFTAKLKSTPKGGKFKLGDKEFTDTSSIEEKKEPKKSKNAFDPEVARSMFAPEKGKTKTGHEVKDTGYSKRYTKDFDDTYTSDEDDDNDAPKKKGRKAVGAGKGKKIGAKHSGTSKLARKGSIKECDTDPEYGQEGDMAKDDLKSAVLAAKELHGILGDNEDLPEWVQAKITKALDYLNASNQYMQRAHDDMDQGEEPIAEKAVSQQQQKFMGMAHAIQKGEKIKGASPELKKVAKTMKKSDVTDFAKTKHAGLPKKVKAKEEEVEETTDAPKAKKSGGVQFGKGIYESMNSQVENMIAEGMNVTVNMSTGEDGQPTKNITVSAEGAEAEALAQLLNLAGLHGQAEHACPQCGESPCGCAEVVDENAPDWPTEEETTGEDDPQLKRWAGGLNGPKSSGQTTAPVVNRDPRRGAVGPMAENTDLGMNLYKEFKNYKSK